MTQFEMVDIVATICKESFQIGKLTIDFYFFRLADMVLYF